jgi:hypothetical protein
MSLPLLPGPYEILDLKEGESVLIHPMKWVNGRVIIHPRYPGAPAEKEIVAIRLFVPREEKPFGAPYWDLTSQTLRASLEPVLDEIVKNGWGLKLIARGTGPAKRYSFQIVT